MPHLRAPRGRHGLRHPRRGLYLHQFRDLEKRREESREIGGEAACWIAYRAQECETAASQSHTRGCRAGSSGSCTAGYICTRGATDRSAIEYRSPTSQSWPRSAASRRSSRWTRSDWRCPASRRSSSGCEGSVGVARGGRTGWGPRLTLAPPGATSRPARASGARDRRGPHPVLPPGRHRRTHPLDNPCWERGGDVPKRGGVCEGPRGPSPGREGSRGDLSRRTQRAAVTVCPSARA